MAQSSRVITALAEDVGSYHLQWESPIPRIWCFLLVSLDSRMHMYTWTHQYSHVCMYTHTRWGHFGESANTSGCGNGLLVAVSSHGYSMSVSVKHPNLIHEDSPPRSYLSSHLYLPQQRLGFSVGTWGRHSSQQLCRKPDGSFFFSYKL